MVVKKPTCMVLANGKDISGLLMGFTDKGDPRLISLRITDQRGYESDSLTIELDDTDGKVAQQPKGAELDVYLGFLDEKGSPDNLSYKGKFVVDEFAHEGPPDKVVITAKAADMLASLKVQKTRSWHGKTLGDIVRTIAAEHGLKPAIGTGFDSIQVGHIDQTNESDLHFLTRIGKKHDGVVKPAAGNLVYVKRGDSTSASGKRMPLIPILRSETSDHHYTEKSRGTHTGVRAYWHDKGKAKRTGVEVGSMDKPKTLSGTYANATEAKQAAQAAYDKQARGEISLSLTLQQGRPELVAEIRILPTGFRSYIDREFVVSEVVHELSGSSGLSCTLNSELPNNQQSTS